VCCQCVVLVWSLVQEDGPGAQADPASGSAAEYTSDPRAPETLSTAWNVDLRSPLSASFRGGRRVPTAFSRLLSQFAGQLSGLTRSVISAGEKRTGCGTFVHHVDREATDLYDRFIGGRERDRQARIADSHMCDTCAGKWVGTDIDRGGESCSSTR
jgi:hypothetical protein